MSIPFLNGNITVANIYTTFGGGGAILCGTLCDMFGGGTLCDMFGGGTLCDIFGGGIFGGMFGGMFDIYW